MKLGDYISNPICNVPIESIEKQTFKDQSFYNKLLKRNLRKIKRECEEEKKSVNIICIGERIFY